MQVDDLRAYAARRWDLVEQQKDRWRAERFRQGGPAATLAVSVALRERWRRLGGRSSDAQRQVDLAHHLELRRKLEQVSGVVGDR